MDPNLVARREAARDRHDHAWELAPAKFEVEMAAVVEALTAIAREAGDAPAEGDIELAKTWRFLGDAWFDLGRIRGAPAHAEALRAFERGVAALAGQSVREEAPLTVGRANAKLGLAQGRDVQLLREAIALYEEALPKVRASYPDDLPGIERSLGYARAMLKAATGFERLAAAQASLGSAAEALKRVEHESHVTPEDRQAKLAMGSSISTDAVVAQLGNAIADFIAASEKAGATDKMRADISELQAMMDKLGTVAQVDPQAVDTSAQELTVLNRLREELATELEAGRVSPVRRIQLEEILDELEGILMMKADDLMAAQSRLGRMARLMSRASALRPEGLDDRLAGLHRAIQALAMRSDAPPEEAEETRRLYVLTARLGPELQASATAGKHWQHGRRLRALAVDVQRHLRRHNVMVAEPLWDCASWTRDPDTLFLAGGEDLAIRLAELCATRSIRLLVRSRGGDEGQHRWDQLRNAGAAMFDLRGPDGPELAATYYELGLATSLGVPWSLLCSEHQALPFDVEEAPIALRADEHEQDRLAAAIDLAFGRPYQGEQSRASMQCTVDAAIRLVGVQRTADRDLQQAVSLVREAANIHDATLLGSALATFLAKAPGHRLQLLHPNRPPLYPEPDTRRVFHVMPFSQPWSAAAMQAAEGACARAGAAYVRGDRPDSARVLRSIWNEVGLATHLVVDLTGFNPNVAFELGLAHARGKKTLLVVRGNDGKAGVFPNIAKLQVRPYADDATLAVLVERFVT